MRSRRAESSLAGLPSDTVRVDGGEDTVLPDSGTRDYSRYKETTSSAGTKKEFRRARDGAVEDASSMSD